MIRFHKLVSTILGIGYISKGGGTVAAIACCLCWYFFQINGYNQPFAIIFTVLSLVLGVWSGNVVEAFWGKDSSKVVIDEVAGMCITLLFIPVTIKYVITGLVLFRFFDIAKPLLIRRLEKWPGGWGVMADDVLAGIYSNIILQVIVAYTIF